MHIHETFEKRTGMSVYGNSTGTATTVKAHTQRPVDPLLLQGLATARDATTPSRKRREPTHQGSTCATQSQPRSTSSRRRR